MAKEAERQDIFDPSVGAILDDNEKKEKTAHLTKKERAKKVKEEKKMSDRLPNRATYDQPPGMKQRVAAIAEEEHTTASQVAAYFIAEGINAYDEGKINLKEHTISTEKSPRYDYILDIPKFKKSSK